MEKRSVPNARKASSKWRATHRTAARKYHLRTNFDLTIEEADQILKTQGGGCAICGTAPSETKALDIDHDHATGQIRGILCNRHNRGLGLFQDNPELLKRAAEYLEEAALRHLRNGL